MWLKNSTHLNKDTRESHDRCDVIAIADDHRVKDGLLHLVHIIVHLLQRAAHHLGQLDIAVDSQHSDAVFLAHGPNESRLNGGCSIWVALFWHHTQHHIVRT